MLILSPDPSDVRIELTRRGIEFWNQAFVDLGIKPVLGEVEVVVASPQTRTFENYSRLVWQRAGRDRTGSHDPAPPREIVDLEADVVVFLSGQPLMPFAWPMGDGSRYFIALANPDASAMNPANGHNVVAHEIGHAMGLSHNRDPDSLMCLPCRPIVGDGSPAYMSLTGSDRARLRELYSAP